MQGSMCRPSGHRVQQLGTVALSIIAWCDLCLLLNHYICSKSCYCFVLYFTVQAVTLLKPLPSRHPDSLFAAATFQWGPTNLICYFLLLQKWWTVGSLTDQFFHYQHMQLFEYLLFPHSCPFSAYCQRSWSFLWKAQLTKSILQGNYCLNKTDSITRKLPGNIHVLYNYLWIKLCCEHKSELQSCLVQLEIFLDCFNIYEVLKKESPAFLATNTSHNFFTPQLATTSTVNQVKKYFPKGNKPTTAITTCMQAHSLQTSRLLP